MNVRTGVHARVETAPGSARARSTGGAGRLRRVGLNAHLQLSELARIPAFTVPSLGLPLITYLIFGLPNAHGEPRLADGLLVGFAAFALLGIVMFQFGVGIAADRASPWERLLRTLPASAAERFAARLVVALVFGCASLVPVCACAVLATPVDLGPVAWARVVACLLLGSIPLGLLGIMLGYLLNERGALPVTNVIYLPLAYAGGLFASSPAALPGPVARISPWLPTRQWSDLIVQLGLGGRLPVHQLLALVGWAGVFAVGALIGYRRDEQRQFA